VGYPRHILYIIYMVDRGDDDATTGYSCHASIRYADLCQCIASAYLSSLDDGSLAIVYVNAVRCRIIPCNTVRCHIVRCHIVRCRIVRCHIVRCRIVRGHIVRCRIVRGRIKSSPGGKVLPAQGARQGSRQRGPFPYLAFETNFRPFMPFWVIRIFSILRKIVNLQQRNVNFSHFCSIFNIIALKYLHGVRGYDKGQ